MNTYSNLYTKYDAAKQVNFFLSLASGEVSNAVIAGTKYFLNDAEMNAKWAPLMQHVEKVCRLIMWPRNIKKIKKKVCHNGTK